MPVRDTIDVQSTIVDAVTELSGYSDTKCSLTIEIILVNVQGFIYECDLPSRHALAPCIACHRRPLVNGVQVWFPVEGYN